jgi:hypothetical protein
MINSIISPVIQEIWDDDKKPTLDSRTLLYCYIGASFAFFIILFPMTRVQNYQQLKILPKLILPMMLLSYVALIVKLYHQIQSDLKPIDCDPHYKSQGCILFTDNYPDALNKQPAKCFQLSPYLYVVMICYHSNF